MSPEGVCEVAWQAWCGSRRHYCENAATCIVLVKDEYLHSCDACRNELIELGVMKNAVVQWS